MSFKTKYFIVYGIILFISGTAFIAGSLQENLSTQANTIQAQVLDLQDTVLRMESKAFFLTSRDITTTYKSIDIRLEAMLVDNELDLLNATISQAQRDFYVKKIVELLIYSQGMQNTLLIIHLYRHFNVTSVDFAIANQNSDGYDYRITYEMWQYYNNQFGSPVYIWNATDYYGLYFSYPLIQALAPEFRPHDPETELEIFIYEGGGIEGLMDFFLYNQVREIQDEINKKSGLVHSLESQATYISLGVSLTTVSMLLATAMITRINHKKVEHEFNILKEKDGREVRIQRDFLSIPVLVIAAILSVLGVFLAIF
ncbi:MAG: hypothetical protein ACFFE4_15260 [Candidatus Thorarchaeota archaeon]